MATLTGRGLTFLCLRYVMWWYVNVTFYCEDMWYHLCSADKVRWPWLCDSRGVVWPRTTSNLLHTNHSGLFSVSYLNERIDGPAWFGLCKERIGLIRGGHEAVCWLFIMLSDLFKKIFFHYSSLFFFLCCIFVSLWLSALLVLLYFSLFSSHMLFFLHTHLLST